jgi:hypothetical protein
MTIDEATPEYLAKFRQEGGRIDFLCDRLRRALQQEDGVPGIGNEIGRAFLGGGRPHIW